MTSSLTTALEEMNEQLRREIDVLKAEVDIAKDELKTNDEKQKDEIRHLTIVLDKMAVTNENQLHEINSQSSEMATIKDENIQLKAEVQQLKVSQWSGIT